MKKDIILKLFTKSAALLFLVSSVLVHASESELTPFEIYSRCFHRISGLSVALNDPMRIELRASTATPDSAIAACFSHLEKVGFNSHAAPGTLVENTKNTQAILKTFNDFHRTWFPNDSMETAFSCSRNKDLFDPSEPALFLTNSLFGSDGSQQIPFSSIVTDPYGLDAKRSDGVPAMAPVTGGDPTQFRQWCTECMPSTDPHLPGSGQASPACAACDDNPLSYATGNLLAPLFIEMGDLMGMRRIDENLPGHFNKKVSVRYLPGGQYYRRSSGAGILGSKSFLLLNFGREVNEGDMDGGRVMPRRWSQAVFKNLMCRELPVLEASDVTTFQAQYASTNTALVFRKSNSCLSCHVTMDLMAGVLRNHRAEVTVNSACNAPFDVVHISKREIATNAPDHPVPWLFDSNNLFETSKPKGKLMYRDIHNNLQNINVDNLQDLGQKLSETDDIYACAASRYLEFFTSIHVPLVALSSDQVQELDDETRYYRNLIVGPDGLAHTLKSTQSSKELIKRILNLPQYRRAGFQR